MGKMNTRRNEKAQAILAEAEEEAAEHQRLTEQLLVEVPSQMQEAMAREQEEHRAFQRRELLQRYADGLCHQHKQHTDFGLARALTDAHSKSSTDDLHRSMLAAKASNRKVKSPRKGVTRHQSPVSLGQRPAWTD